GTIAGRITSSRYSPTLNRSICLAQVDLSLSEPGTMLTIRQVDGTLVQAKVMSEMAAVDPEGARLDNDTVPEQLTTFAEPIARGPVGLGAAIKMIDDWVGSAHPRSCALSLQVQSALAKLEVRSKANGALGKQLETNFGRVHQREQGSLVVGSGTGQWHIFADVCTQASVLAELQE